MTQIINSLENHGAWAMRAWRFTFMTAAMLPVFLSQLPAHALNLPIHIDVDAASFKSASASVSNSFTLSLCTDSSCSSCPINTSIHAWEIESTEQVARAKVKNDPIKATKMTRLRHVLGGVPAAEQYFAQVSGSGIIAVPSCQPQGPVRGQDGPAGAAGIPGEAGAAGATGSVGAVGPTGPAGATGPTGETGSPGADGIAGLAGADGASGATGATGAAGDLGAEGEAGADGPVGPAGSTPSYTLPTEVTISTNESTSSNSYTDLSTVGPTAVVNVSQAAEVTISAAVGFFSFANCLASVQVSGANTLAVSDARAIYNQPNTTGSNQGLRASVSHLLTGLNPGSTTFTMKYKASNSLGYPCYFEDRTILVTPY